MQTKKHSTTKLNNFLSCTPFILVLFHMKSFAKICILNLIDSNEILREPKYMISNEKVVNNKVS
jgi:hypothetical protein